MLHTSPLLWRNLVADKKYPHLSRHTSSLSLKAGLSPTEAVSLYEALLGSSSEVQLVLHPDSVLISHASPNVDKRYGYAWDKIVHTDFLELIHKDDQPLVCDKLHLARNSPGIALKGECRIRHARKGFQHTEFSIVAPDSDSIVKGVVISLRDITEKMAMIRALSESREHLDLAVHGAQLGIWDWNIKQGRIFYNPEWANMLGYSLEEIGSNLAFWEEVLHPDDRDRAKAAIEAHLKGQSEMYSEEYRIQTRASGFIWIQDTGKVMERDSSGTPVRMAGIHQDITARKDGEALLLKQKNRLEQVNQELEELAYITSHNLRAPLANIDGLVEFYHEELAGKALVNDWVSRINSSVNELRSSLETMEQVVSLYTNPHEGEGEVSLEAALRLALRPYRKQMDSIGAAVQYDFKQAPSIYYPKAHLVRMFSTLLSNAIHFQNPDRQLLVKVTSADEPPYRVIEFRDNGLGIDLEQHGDKLFQIHQRFNTQGTGKGLGLFMLKKLITYLGGRVEVESEVDIGTGFKLFLLNQNGV